MVFSKKWAIGIWFTALATFAAAGYFIKQHIDNKYQNKYENTTQTVVVKDSYLEKIITKLEQSPQTKPNQTEQIEQNESESDNRADKITLISGEGKNPPYGVAIECKYFKVGQRTQFSITAKDNKKIKWLGVFEDRKLKKEFKGDSYIIWKLFDITKETAGIHDYFLLVQDQDGNIVKTDSITVQYTGQIEDRKPIIDILNLNSSSKVGRTAELNLYVSDFKGDNRGLEKITLYEDGEIYQKFKSEHYNFDKTLEITKPEAESHVYVLEATDIGGHTVQSEPLELFFNQ